MVNKKVKKKVSKKVKKKKLADPEDEIQESIDEIREKCDEIEEQIMPKKATSYGDPVVELG